MELIVKQRRSIEARTNTPDFDAVRLCSSHRSTIWTVLRARGESGEAYGFDASDTDAGRYLQFENGTLFADDSTEFSNRSGVNQVTKLGVLPRLELLLQSEPLVVNKSEDRVAVREGEVFSGVQGVLLPGAESRPAISVSYIRRLHASAAPELDIGTFRQSATVLVRDNLRGFHVDANAIVAEQAQGELQRAQFGQTLSISHPLGKFTISREIWHFSQPFERGNAVGTCGRLHTLCAKTWWWTEDSITD